MVTVNVPRTAGCPELVAILQRMEGPPGQHRGLLDIYVRRHNALEAELARPLTNDERIDIAQQVLDEADGAPATPPAEPQGW